jgi:hypothetical protein
MTSIASRTSLAPLAASAEALLEAHDLNVTLALLLAKTAPNAFAIAFL